jgi:hypothetical protein
MVFESESIGWKTNKTSEAPLPLTTVIVDGPPIMPHKPSMELKV